MSETQKYLSVGVDEVVDSDAFRNLALQAELGLPVEATGDGESDPF